MRGRITLGLLLDQLVTGYARVLVKGVADWCRDHDVNLVVFSGTAPGGRGPHERGNNAVYGLVKKGTVDALVLVAGGQEFRMTPEEFSRFLRGFEGIPLVTVGAKVEGVPRVLVDNRSGALAAMDHLADHHGYGRIAFLKGPRGNREAEERFSAYREAVKAKGLEEDPRLWIQGDFSRQGARKAMTGYLQTYVGPGFQALFAVNDEAAIAASEVLREWGFELPGTVAVMGFDNVSASQFAVPAISTVDQGIAQQGQIAAWMAMGLALGDAVKPEVVVPARLVLRTSCGCMPMSVKELDALPLVAGRRRRGASSPKETARRCVRRVSEELHLPPDRAMYGLLVELVDRAGSEDFVSYLQKKLHERVSENVDVSPWPSILTALHVELVGEAGSAGEAGRLHSLFRKSRVLLSDILRLEQGRRLMELRGHINRLNNVMERLISVASVEELMTNLAGQLEELDIGTCFVVHYPGEVRQTGEVAWKVPGRAEVALATRDGAKIPLSEAQRIFSPTERLLPDGLLPSRRRFTLVARAMFFREDRIGYIVFEPGNRDAAIYEAFCVQLGNVLESSSLFASRQKMVDALARERSFIEMLMDTIPDHIYFKDEDSRFILVNKALARAFGAEDPARVAGKMDFDFFTEEHARPAFEAEQDIIRTGQPIENLEERETWPDRADTWALTNKLPLRDREGNIVGTFGISRDITHRKRAEEELRISERRYRDLVEQAGDGIGIVDGEGKFVMANSSLCEMLGYAREEVLQLRVSDIDLTDTAVQDMHRLLAVEAGVPARFQRRLKRRDGSSIPVEASVVRLADGRLQAIIRDLTEMKRMERQLLQSEKMASIGQLAAGVAHEINNPNAFIMSNLTTLGEYMEKLRAYISQLEKGRDVKELREYFGITFILEDFEALRKESLEGTQRVESIVRSLRDFAHADKGTVARRNVNELLEGTLRVIHNEIKYKGRVEKDYGELPDIPCYPQRLQQVFLNLLVNAAQAIESNGVIGVSTALEEGEVVVRVRDNGKGISKEVQQRIFEPFFTTKDIGNGTGLGLAIAYDIVQAHKGRIDVESAPGKGTEFTIRLPMEAELEEG